MVISLPCILVLPYWQEIVRLLGHIILPFFNLDEIYFFYPVLHLMLHTETRSGTRCLSSLAPGGVIRGILTGA